MQSVLGPGGDSRRNFRSSVVKIRARFARPLMWNEIMDYRQALHDLVEKLGDRELLPALSFLEYLRGRTADPLRSLLEKAPTDDEPMTEEDLTAIREGLREKAQDQVISQEEIKRILNQATVHGGFARQESSRQGSELSAGAAMAERRRAASVGGAYPGGDPPSRDGRPSSSPQRPRNFVREGSDFAGQRRRNRSDDFEPVPEWTRSLIADGDHDDDEPPIVDLVDDSVGTDPNAPCLPARKF